MRHEVVDRLFDPRGVEIDPYLRIEDDLVLIGDGIERGGAGGLADDIDEGRRLHLDVGDRRIGDEDAADRLRQVDELALVDGDVEARRGRGGTTPVALSPGAARTGSAPGERHGQRQDDGDQAHDLSPFANSWILASVPRTTMTLTVSPSGLAGGAGSSAWRSGGSERWVASLSQVWL